MVSMHFKQLIEANYHLLVREATLHNIFPKLKNLDAFLWVAERGNLEAMIKLGLAYLYNEGLSQGHNYRQLNSESAAKYFCALEESTHIKEPFTWMFIRPPWSTATQCCKAYVLDNMISHVNNAGNENAHLHYCIGKVLLLFENDDDRNTSAIPWLEKAAKQGLPHSQYELWCLKLKSHVINMYNINSCDPGMKLEFVRNLRTIANTGYVPAQLHLSYFYASGLFAGNSVAASHYFVRQVFNNSCALNMSHLFQIQTNMTENMRYILVDWLIEVSNMKEFSSSTLHCTIRCIDRYLLEREVPRTWLQLMGIACLVICTRHNETDLLTIREAVWLTDNTYKYETLVRMIGEIMSVLRGSVKTLNAHEYLNVLLAATPDRRTKTIAQFLCDSSLLHSTFGSYTDSLLASSCLYLAMICTGTETKWVSMYESLCGASTSEMMPVVLKLHKKCVRHSPPTDYRNTTLYAINDRYSDVHELKAMLPSLKHLLETLKLSECDAQLMEESMSSLHVSRCSLKESTDDSLYWGDCEIASESESESDTDACEENEDSDEYLEDTPLNAASELMKNIKANVKATACSDKSSAESLPCKSKIVPKVDQQHCVSTSKTQHLPSGKENQSKSGLMPKSTTKRVSGFVQKRKQLQPLDANSANISKRSPRHL